MDVTGAHAILLGESVLRVQPHNQHHHISQGIVRRQRYFEESKSFYRPQYCVPHLKCPLAVSLNNWNKTWRTAEMRGRDGGGASSTNTLFPPHLRWYSALIFHPMRRSRWWWNDASAVQHPWTIVSSHGLLGQRLPFFSLSCRVLCTVQHIIYGEHVEGLNRVSILSEGQKSANPKFDHGGCLYRIPSISSMGYT